MSIWGETILPRLIHRVLRGPEFLALRQKYLEGVEGDLLEIGFGSGLNLPYLGTKVSRLFALEPSDGAWSLAAPAIRAAPFLVERIGETAERIPLPDASLDGVVSTWTLCTIPDADRALAEVRRILKPGASLRFVEHGRSSDPRVARWQDRLNPIQKRLAGGCNLNRPIDTLLERAGFRLEALDRFYARSGPKIGTFLYAGRAAK